MRILDQTESTAWLTSRNLPVFPSGRISLGYTREVSYPIPPDSGAKTAIAKQLAEIFGKCDEAMLLIDEFGIWPSSENWCLFEGFRQSLGEQRPLYDAPGHVFTSADTAVASALLAMVLYFVWGAVLVCSSGDLVVRISHDEMIDAYAKDGTGLANNLFDRLADLTADENT